MHEVVKLAIFELDEKLADMRDHIVQEHEQAKSELRKFAQEVQMSVSNTAQGVPEKKGASLATLKDTSVDKIPDGHLACGFRQ